MKTEIVTVEDMQTEINTIVREHCESNEALIDSEGRLNKEMLKDNVDIRIKDHEWVTDAWRFDFADVGGYYQIEINCSSSVYGWMSQFAAEAIDHLPGGE